MRTGLLLCCLAAVGSSGCMSTHPLWGESPEVVSRSIRELQGEDVDITLSNGAYYEDVCFSSFGDSVAFRAEDTKVPTVVPLSSLVSVSKPGSAVGPIAGCLGGLFLGVAIGASIALEDHASVERKDPMEQFGAAITAPMATAAGGMVGGLLGGAVGLIIGSIAGSGDRYILDPGPDPGTLADAGERCIAATVTASGDTTTLGVAGLIGTSPGKVTVRWHGKTRTFSRPPAQVVRKGRDVLVIAPESAWH